MNANLEKHLTDMHDKAMKVEGLVHALNACICDPDLHSTCVTMIEALAEIAPGLTVGLDTPSRFEERRA